VEHKPVTFNFIYNHLSTYPLNKTNKNLEAKIIKQIAYENIVTFPITLISRNIINIKKPTLWPIHNTSDTHSNSSENEKMGHVHMHRKINLTHNKII
jgi:hypothetical protein